MHLNDSTGAHRAGAVATHAGGLEIRQPERHGHIKTRISKRKARLSLILQDSAGFDDFGRQPQDIGVKSGLICRSVSP